MSVEIINYYEFVIFSYYETFWFLGINGVYVLGFKWFALLLFIFDYFFLQGLVFKLFHIIFSIQYRRKILEISGFWINYLFSYFCSFGYFYILTLAMDLSMNIGWTDIDIDIGKQLLKCMNNKDWQMLEWMDGWKAGWLVGWMNERMNEWMNGLIFSWTNEWTFGWLFGNHEWEGIFSWMDFFSLL